MKPELAASYAYCERAAAQAHSNFYWSFRLLPQAKRRAMCALYAFFRQADDIGDQPGEIRAKHAALSDFRAQMATALSGSAAGHLWPAFADAVQTYHIPSEYFTAVLDGVAMDLDGFRPTTFTELELYCYRVASVVGLACLHVWGFDSPTALQTGQACGIAFQLTNILRDLDEDRERGRCYLPVTEIGEQFPAELTQSQFVFQCDRILNYFRAAQETERYLQRDGRRIFGAMLETYAHVFHAVRRAGPANHYRVRLSRWRKARLLTKWLFLPRPHIHLPF